MAEEELRRRIAELEAEVSRLGKVANLPYRAVVDDMSELVVRWKPDGTRLFVNNAYCRLFGARLDEIIGTSFWPLITDEDRAEVQTRIAALRAEHPVTTGRHRAVGPGGSIIWMEWVDRAVFDDDGRLLELQSVGRDITERATLEEQARRVAQGDAAARASASIAHDLRNVLLVIGGVTSLIAEAPEDRSLVDVMKDAIQKANRLLTQLTNVGHGVVVQARPLDLRERVSQLRGLLREVTGRTVRLEESHHTGPCRIVADPTQIDQVLLNLARNAAEAMPSGGTLRIHTSIAMAAVVPEGRRPPGVERCVLLRIEDDGPGIDPEILPRVFDAGVTTKPERQGLGLATVKAIVESRSGTVSVTSTNGGTSFEIVFPLASD